ncbi:ParA family protein [Adlercreutzia mucosicola]|uniref:ParA family protein n=1 Tax=Adlercreutzia mucosicola TaxID=580026 RepID=UPI002B243BE3|nr:ParA family protein [Adlercreutzia mucosicola]MEB1813472.1 ParA family protein [Adlercreutzia mucosicola]
MERETAPFEVSSLAPVVVVVGHYGVGKTNFALNLALDAAAAGRAVTLADMDVVNPYFRSSEYAAVLDAAGVRLVAPVFAGAGTSLDVPSLTGAVVPAIQAAYAEAVAPAPVASGAVGRPLVIIDAGGDDVGATALARFAGAIQAGPHEVIYVANAFRNLTQEPAEAVAVLREIEAKSRLAVTAVAGNSHLQGETRLGHIIESVPFAQMTAAQAGLPLRCITVPMSAIRRENAEAAALAAVPKSYPVRVLVSVPWAPADA